MPMFIKMGNGGTGYLGKKESYSRALRRRQNRRKVLPGYPIAKPFETIDDVRDYLSGDRVICLLCGQSFKKLGGQHLKLHGVTTDSYRERYNIPWTYGLAGKETRNLHRDVMKKLIKSGGIQNIGKTGYDHEKMISSHKRKCPFKVEVANQNKPKFEIIKDGLSKTALKLKNAVRIGTKEHSEKMKARPQCQKEFIEKHLVHYWKGKKQSPEHFKKRMVAIHGREIVGGGK